MTFFNGNSVGLRAFSTAKLVFLRYGVTNFAGKFLYGAHHLTCALQYVWSTTIVSNINPITQTLCENEHVKHGLTRWIGPICASRRLRYVRGSFEGAGKRRGGTWRPCGPPGPAILAKSVDSRSICNILYVWEGFENAINRKNRKNARWGSSVRGHC